MLPDGYIQSRYWPGNYWSSTYFPAYGAVAPADWHKIALEKHDAEFVDVTLDSLTADDTSIAMNSPVTGISLSEIENLEGDKTFTMAAKTLTWTFTNPNGGIKYEWLGGASGHLFELLQETGNPMAGTHLAHIDATDADVLNLHLQHRGAAGTEVFRISDSTTTNLTIDNSGNISCNDITINSPSNIYSSLGGLLEDLNTLGASASDGQIIVATGAGTLAWESGDTARISLGFPTTGGASGKYLRDDLSWGSPSIISETRLEILC